MLGVHTPRVIATVRKMRLRLKKPAVQVTEFLETLHRQGLPQTVSLLSEYAGSV